MIVSKLDVYHYDSIKRAKEALSQRNRCQFREDLTDAKSRSRRHGMKSKKVEAIYFGDTITKKTGRSFLRRFNLDKSPNIEHRNCNSP